MDCALYFLILKIAFGYLFGIYITGKVVAAVIENTIFKSTKRKGA